MNHDLPVGDATILIVDDQPELVDSIGMALEAAGHTVLSAGDGQTALGLLESEPVDLILADIAMPRMNGYQFYERVRENVDWIRIPFLFLTARTMDSDVRYGKELGVDDYLTKPIQPEDLLASVNGKLRRARQLAEAAAPAERTSAGEGFLQAGRLRIELGQHRVWMQDELIKLSAKEFALLEHLGRNQGRVVSAQDLIKITHGLTTDYVEAGTLLRPLIRTLRRKMGYDVGEMGCIENVRGVGYRLVAEAA
ncbi:MAG: response regulator transcription factor [Chloroflexi bacterium]|nr:response regulator transcription factor [Chloroflexota bacterium]